MGMAWADFTRLPCAAEQRAQKSALAGRMATSMIWCASLRQPTRFSTMSDDSIANQRFTELEIRLSFADDAIAALDMTVFRQSRQIEQLQQELRDLRRLVLESTPATPSTLRDELPPHY
ncbi:MAG TPA: SlyX family protein [Rhodocyclaceae bacterium]|nr:SlyX family protein [Rhodocyclaceae bacterium]